VKHDGTAWIGARPVRKGTLPVRLPPRLVTIVPA
jgi:hypothetical protein